MTDDPTKRIGDYEVLGVLGAGGMGKVFKVRNVISDRVEAMKILLPDLAGRQELADRFLREIKLLASLDHPNIAQLRTALTLSNRLVMVMEYVEGTTLSDRLEQGPIPPEEAMGYVIQVLNALAYAHGRNVIHRDIKPANMMITANGNVKLMDFGIARASGDQSMTTTGTTVGSLFYMSPEQVKGEGVDFRSDLYSLGVSLYEMVTGERPFKASSDYSLMTAQLQERPKPPSELRPGLPPQLNGIILHSMAKDPAERFQSADEFRQALEALRQTMPASAGTFQPVVAAPPAPIATPPMQPVPAAPPIAATSVFSPDLAPPPTATGVQVPPAPVPPLAQPAPSVMQMSPPSKGRGLYMALGAVIVLVVLVLAGISLPRMLKTRANEQKPADQSQASQASGSQTTTPPATDNSGSTAQSSGTSGTTSQDAGTTSQPPADTGTSGASSGTASGTATASSGSGSGGSAASTDSSMSAGAGTPPPASTSKSKGKKGKSKSGDSTVSSTSDPGSSMQGSSAQGSSMSTSGDQGQGTTDAAQKESFEELEQDVDHTSGRAAAANSSLDTMTKQLRSQGLNLRGDIVAAQEAMKINLDKANQALQRNDTKSARRYLNMAQANMEKIEKFLGH